MPSDIHTHRGRGRLLRTAGTTASRAVSRGREVLRLVAMAGPLGALQIHSLARRSSGTGPPRAVRLRPLANEQVHLRPGTTDAVVAVETFLGLYHEAPPEVSSPGVIWDLGSNIGLTVAHYAVTFPEAVVRGVELDRGTANAAERNVAPWKERCSIIVGAVWTEDGEIAYTIDQGDEYGAHIAQDGLPGAHTVEAFSIDTLTAGDAVIDFMKMDIEGAERAVLRTNTAWAARLRAIKVEIHEPYTLEECESDLRALGFRTRLDNRHWASVIGIKVL